MAIDRHNDPEMAPRPTTTRPAYPQSPVATPVQAAAASPTYPDPSASAAPSTFGDSAVPSLASSPSYQAYLRELGLSEADTTNDEMFREAMLRRQVEPGSANMAQLDQQGQLQRENILGSMEARGLYRSGETEHAIGLQRASEATQKAALQGQINDQIALLQHNLAQQLAGIAKTRAEGTLSSAGGIYGL